MKKIFFTLFVLCSISMFSQQRTGISYQALILNPNGEQLPGFNNQNSPLVSTDICLEFLIIDENGVVEYSENQSVKTDKYGMVNLSIGNGIFSGGYSGGWNDIIWSEKSKKLKVNLDVSGSCTSFTEISNQDLTAVPFALFAPGQEGLDGESAYEIWLSEGNSGSVQDYLDSLKGEKGDDGLSAFEIWKDLGNTETKEDFIQDLKGEDGEDGKSAYQIWLDSGNTGTKEEFLNSLKGDSGGDGVSASQSLIRTVVEIAGSNCSNGGIKIETGIDSNDDGILSDDEVNSSQTTYLCNGNDGEDGEDGEDGDDGEDGSSSGKNCYDFEVLGAIETTMNVSGISHDTNYMYYPNVSAGSVSSNVSGTDIRFTSLNTNKFVVSSSSSHTRMPNYNLTIQGYDSNGVLLDLSIKIEQNFWIRTNYSDWRGRAGGGFQFINNNSPRMTHFYYNGSEFKSEMGSIWTDSGGADGPVEYSLNLEISSNKSITDLVIKYTPIDNWTTRGAGYTTSVMTTSFINYKCLSN